MHLHPTLQNRYTTHQMTSHSWGKKITVCCNSWAHVHKRTHTHIHTHSKETQFTRHFHVSKKVPLAIKNTNLRLISADNGMHAWTLIQLTDVIALDFSKAFDRVPHRRLLYKLDHYGIRGPVLQWIQNFLENRSQQAVIEGQESCSIKVTSGISPRNCFSSTIFMLH